MIKISVKIRPFQKTSFRSGDIVKWTGSGNYDLLVDFQYRVSNVYQIKDNNGEIIEVFTLMGLENYFFSSDFFKLISLYEDET
jgi:hypothetical protein